eukprot:scaffold15696_cov113-Isochrysis_galbana.AAC.2
MPLPHEAPPRMRSRASASSRQLFSSARGVEEGPAFHRPGRRHAAGLRCAHVVPPTLVRAPRWPGGPLCAQPARRPPWR